MQHYAVIVRADGTVPFDVELDTIHRQAIIEGLKSQGHDVYYDGETNEHKIRNHNANVGRPQG